MAAEDLPVEKKRSRPSDEDELEIDLNLPEPPSKKAKRLAKKSGNKPNTTEGKPNGSAEARTSAVTDEDKEVVTKKRSDWAIWIGNLEFSVSKDNLRTFLTSKGDIADVDITRIYMPAPGKQESTRALPKRLHKGFAYVDFVTEQSMNKAIALSEELFAGRKVLIKNAKSFEGRPDPKTTADTKQSKSGHPPNKRVWVGNLSYDIDPDDLRKHFSQAGEIEDVSLMTWEDSGRCKGFGFIRFADLDSAQAAVKGFIFKDNDQADDEADEQVVDEQGADETLAKPSKKKKKPHKWYINRLFGRQLDVQFAEDSSTRYKKRHGRTEA